MLILNFKLFILLILVATIATGAHKSKGEGSKTKRKAIQFDKDYEKSSEEESESENKIIKVNSVKFVHKRSPKSSSHHEKGRKVSSGTGKIYKKAKSASTNEIPLARKKGSRVANNPVGTIVKIPHIHNISDYDAVLVDILESDVKSSKVSSEDSSEQPLGRIEWSGSAEDNLVTTTTKPPPTKPKKGSPSRPTETKSYMKSKNGTNVTSNNGKSGGGIHRNDTGTKTSSEKDINLIQGKQPEVKSKGGVFYRGRVLNVGSKEVYVFYGIPYASPPTGSFRFKRPFPPEPFPVNSTFEATKINAPCFPTRLGHGRTSMSAAIPDKHRDQNMLPIAKENCLYLNILLPSTVTKSKELSPVLVWIHGEGFLSGLDEEDYESAAFFVGEANVIVISIQYRLGVFGFLHVGTSEAPGNMGLLDQIQAMRWIDENIESFGGDPNSITIMGHDIGASFVGTHLISKISPSFFKRAIMIGGAPTQPHVFKFDHIAKQLALEFAKDLGCVNTESIRSIIDCLRKADPVEIWDAQALFHSDVLSFPFVPTQDGFVLDDNPLTLLVSGKGKITQVLIGGTSNEGSMTLIDSVAGMSKEKPTFISYDKFIRILSHLLRDFGELELDAVLQQYKNWQNPEDGLENQRKLAEAIGDHYFTCPLRQFSDAWSGRGLNTYHFQFSQKSSALNRSQWMGSVHGDEIDFFFGVPIKLPDKFTPNEVQLSRKLVKILGDFIRTGVPSPGWERYGKETPIYLDLTASKITDTTSATNYGPRAKECGFWNEFFPKLKSMIPTDLGNYKTEPVSSYSIDEHCIVSLQNCTNSNLAIYVNGNKS